MRLSEIYKILDEIAPKALSDEYCAKYGAYDNSGILVDVGEDVTSILFTLDLTNASIAHAKEIGANLIVTHHPVIYGKIGNIRADDIGLLGGKLVDAVDLCFFHDFTPFFSRCFHYNTPRAVLQVKFA